MSLGELVEQASRYKVNGHEKVQLTTDSSGAEVVVVKTALPLTFVSGRLQFWLPCLAACSP